MLFVTPCDALLVLKIALNFIWLYRLWVVLSMFVFVCNHILHIARSQRENRKQIIYSSESGVRNIKKNTTHYFMFFL